MITQFLNTATNHENPIPPSLTIINLSNKYHTKLAQRLMLTNFELRKAAMQFASHMWSKSLESGGIPFRKFEQFEIIFGGNFVWNLLSSSKLLYDCKSSNYMTIYLLRYSNNLTVTTFSGLKLPPWKLKIFEKTACIGGNFDCLKFVCWKFNTGSMYDCSTGLPLNLPLEWLENIIPWFNFPFWSL